MPRRRSFVPFLSRWSWISLVRLSCLDQPLADANQLSLSPYHCFPV